MQNAIHFCTGPAGGGAFFLRHVGVHHHESRAGVLFDDAGPFVVIAGMIEYVFLRNNTSGGPLVPSMALP